MYSTEHRILRQIPASAQVAHRLERRPARVATLIDEAEFIAKGHWLKHNQTVFFEDSIHDWNYVPVDKQQPNGPGDFYYYTRVAQQADVVLVFSVAKEPAFNTSGISNTRT